MMRAIGMNKLIEAIHWLIIDLFDWVFLLHLLWWQTGTDYARSCFIAIIELWFLFAARLFTWNIFLVQVSILLLNWQLFSTLKKLLLLWCINLWRLSTIDSILSHNIIIWPSINWSAVRSTTWLLSQITILTVIYLKNRSWMRKRLIIIKIALFMQAVLTDVDQVVIVHGATGRPIVILNVWELFIAFLVSLLQ